MKQKFYLLMTAILMGLTAAAQVPTAEILDVVFNADGTATDVSPMGSKITVVGAPYVEASTKYGINVGCFRNNAWGQSPKGFFRVDYEENDDIIAAMEESHSFEALIRPLEDPQDYNVTSKYFSNQQTGGGALSIAGSSQNFSLFYADYIGEKNKNVYSGVTPEPGKYYHVIGTWDKEEGLMSIYVNGELCATLDADGAYKHPVEGSVWFCIGADPSSKGNATNAFTGDIAIARVYDYALEEEDIEALYEAVQAMDTGADEHVDVVELEPYFSMPNGTINAMTCTPLEEEYSYELVTTGPDPYIYWSALQKKLGDEETILTFDYKCTMGAPGSEFFFSPIAAGREFFFDIPATGDEWTPFYIDMVNPIASNNWGNAGDHLRLDLGADAGITMQIRNIHFITKTEYLNIIGSEINLQQDAEGYYVINTDEDLIELARVVNNGIKSDMKVRQMEDISLNNMEWTPIGMGSGYGSATGTATVVNGGFEGLYDGQGHTVSNFTIVDGSSEAIGLFGIVTGTVKNLGVDNATYNATKDCRAGALAGTVTASGRSVGLVENCFAMNSSILTGQRVAGGLVGAVCGGVVQNCYAANNEITGYGDRFGGIAGDTKNDGNWTGTVKNCYTDHGRVTSSQAGTTTGSQANVSSERFASGEITYKLNGSLTTLESVWRQDTGDDEYPVLDSTHGYVLSGGDGYFSIGEDGFELARDVICAAEYSYSENVICQASLADEYVELIDRLSEASEITVFFALYNEVTAKKAELMESARHYAAYQAKIDDVKAYLEENPSVTGHHREVLEAYLDETIEPGDTYPNGSYAYIMDERELDNAALDAEIDFVQELLDRAIAGGYTAGADITNLIKNADFSQSLKSWTVENGSMSVSNVAGAGTKYVVFSNEKTQLSQTVTDLQPGFYQVKVSAAFRAGGDKDNMNQAAFLFANDNKVYLPTMREGYIPVETESPNVDRYDYVEDEDGNVIGYMATSTTAMAYAFGEGAYESTIVTEVGEDGTLTLGINTPGCNSSNETWVGAFRLRYCGTADTETASAAFDETLECQIARLSTLVYDYDADSYDYSATPNFSEELKNEVEAAVEAGPAADNKFEQITALGELMQKVYDCKQAYAVMLSKVEILQDIYSSLDGTGLLTNEEKDRIIYLYGVISDAYVDGTYTLEEALKVDPFEGLTFLPDIVDNVATITNPKEFIMFGALVNSGFYRDLDAILTTDIDMEGVVDYAPIGVTSVNYGVGQQITEIGYAGTFDGKGHVVKNLQGTYNSSYSVSGVFGTVTGTVKNLGVVNYYFNMNDAPSPYGGRFAALCGVVVEGTILNCYVTGSTVIKADEIVSAIAAGNYGGVVENCYEYGNNIQNYPRAGYLVGDARDDNGVRTGTEINCYSEKFVTGAGRTDGYASNMVDCQSGVSASRFKSGEIAYLLNGGATEGDDVVWYQTILEDESPVLDNTHYIVRLLDNGSYANFDEVNANLLALIQEATALSASLKVVEGEPLITSETQLSENCLWAAGYEIKNIIDGDPLTYFHSRTDIPLSDGTEYFQVNLSSPISGFTMEYTGRSDGIGKAEWHDTPDQFRIMATNTPDSEGSWVTVAEVSYNIPNEHGVHFKTEEPILLGSIYSSIRFYVLHSTSNLKYWNIAEFQMYNVSNSDESVYMSSPEITKAVDDLDAALAEKLALVKKGEGTQADYDQLEALLDIVRDLAGIAKTHAGTQDDPLEIATAEDFVNLHNMMRTGEMTYVKLTADIDMSEAGNWMPLNDATNTANGKSWMNWIDFDGQGHVVSNLSCANYDYASVFGVFCGHVYSVGFENVDISCTSTGSGALGGYMGHNNYADADGNKLTSSFENVWVTGKLSVSSAYCGGMVGNVGGPSIIKNCYTNLEITSDVNYTGGIVGRVRDALTIENVYAAGTQSKGGGIIGGGQNASTPAGTYTNCVVWNNATDFGPVAEGDVVSGTRYYDGTNFSALQEYVVGWGAPWTCDMAAGSYPTFDKELLTSIQQIAVRPATTLPTSTNIYTLDGRMVKANATSADVKALPKGLYIIGGRKVVK